MQIGAVFPHQEIGDDPLVIRDWAQAVEEIGYSHILAYDHVIGAVHADRDPPLWGPYTEQDAFHEPFVLFGYFAWKSGSISADEASSFCRSGRRCWWRSRRRRSTYCLVSGCVWV